MLTFTWAVNKPLQVGPEESSQWLRTKSAALRKRTF